MAERVIVSGEPIASVDKMREGWEKTQYVLEPLIHTLPKRVRIYFQSIVRFLIGKDVALSNIEPNQMYAFIQCAQNILLFITYVKLGGNMEEYINRRICEYQNMLKTNMAKKALFLRYYSGSVQTVTQRLISEHMPEETRRGKAPREYEGEIY